MIWLVLLIVAVFAAGWWTGVYSTPEPVPRPTVEGKLLSVIVLALILIVVIGSLVIWRFQP